MKNRSDFLWIIVIVVMLAGSIWLVLDENFPIRRGLDLQGGLQVLLEADVPSEQDINKEQMDTARQIIDQRVNALGVAEPIVQVEGDRRILVELPGIDNPEDAISLIHETALLEFIDTGSTPLDDGTCVITSENTEPSSCQTVDGVLVQAPSYETVMTGAALREAHVETDNFDQPLIAFTLQPDQKDFFAEYTRAHQGDFLTIVLDKQVISSPRISSVIDSGQGTITGQFTLEEAQKLALQLRFGSLPVPLRIESTRQVGATLGAQSVEASIRAGAIGVAMVLLFMLLYYRLPGIMADIALIFYMLLNFAIFETLPVTLTLPAITGFLLSTGMAVDANVLIFERLKEELGKGAGIKQAVDTGFSKAWISIRDSNVATLVICMVLWLFGRSFGASAVQGFALTLAIGVLVSMFTAVIVTRSLVKLVIGGTAKRLQKHIWLLGA
jgi:protein-export membrane protein SecD